MSVEAMHRAPTEWGGQEVSHQFEAIEQQNDSYIVGMWAFLVTEIMFFGALFAAYLVYRFSYPDVFARASQELNVWMGFGNTLILLSSSLSMAFAVHYAQLGRRMAQVWCLLITVGFALGFMVIKYFEYSEKYHHNLIPGPFFRFHGSNPTVAQMYFNLYFAMTGLHGLHVLVGIFVLGTIAILAWRKSALVKDYMTTELAGLYWHFVDIVWIFLYPLLYLISPR